MSERDDELVQLRVPSQARPPAPWRNLDERAQTPEFLAAAAGELGEPPDAATAWSRRTFLQMLGAGVALAGLDGCTRALPEKIVPYSIAPADVVPGVPRSYATSMMLDGFATGLVVESSEGRPTKIEGNPDHPASRGKSGLWQQASLLQLYDPDRARRVRHGRQPSSWQALVEALRRPRSDGGAGLRLLLEPTGSPTVARLLARVRAVHPRCKVTFWAPLPAVAHTVAGAELAFGRPLQPRYDFAAADVIVALDADFLGAMPFHLAYAQAWAQRRRVTAPDQEMSRLYVVECAPSTTGTMADHRLRRRSADIAAVARAIGGALPQMAAVLATPVALDASGARFAGAVARDLLRRARGHTLVVVGERQPPALHALGWAMNAALGNLGVTVRATEPVLLAGDHPLDALVAEMAAGAVDTVVLLEGNPVYAAPADLHFGAALDRVAERIYLAEYDNETAARCTWVAPAAHYLESWGDGRAYDGTVSVQQPLIEPLHDGHTPAELLAALAGDRAPDGHRLVKETHAAAAWDEALQRGLVEGTALPMVAPTTIAFSAIAAALDALPRVAAEALELDFYASPTLHDGRFSNNPWLLEQPEPMTKLTWDNALLMSPATATEHALNTQDVVELRWDGRTLRAPVFVTPGHADGAVSLWLGYGRRGAESSAAGCGVDANVVRTSRNLSFGVGASLRKLGTTHQLATTQVQRTMMGRPIALAATATGYRDNPAFTADYKGDVPTLMPAVEYQGVQWAMSIDLGICTGCSACMLACQSENNLPVVGKINVLKKREMHWLRIDSYFTGSVEDPGAIHQPMMCQHCEMAPCEYVCPVNATVHSPDGLNEMVYNRCVGTRFCSNNCPYKVRRFNWFDWNERVAANQGSFQLAHNPDVTVRERGVMEKCTYCVQRIRETGIRAELQGRPIRPGEVVTACQQACPTGAIEFGSLSHADTPMVRWRNEPRSYAVLNDQGTRPRTMYLARIDNPNPELV